MAEIEQEKIEKAKKIVKKKIREWYKKVRSLKFDDLEPNIFLAGALGITNARDFIEFCVRQHIERSIVTSFGFLIEEVASIIGVDTVRKKKKEGKKEGWDLKVIRDHTYYIEVKSGPISCNKDMVQKISKDQKQLKEEDPDAKVCLGLLYGKRDDVFGIIEQYYQGDMILVGKEFWEFISGDPDAYKKVLNLIVEASKEVLEESLDKKPLLELIEEKIDELTEEWVKKYGDKLDYNEIIKKFF